MTDWTVALEAKAELGECPRWHAGEGLLYWVDIARCEFHRFDPASGRDEARTFARPVGCFAFMAGGGFVLGMKDGFALLRDWTGEPEPFGDQMLAGKPDLRMNDGRTDPAGRFWAGSVNTAKSAHDAALYCLSPDGGIRTIEGGMLTCNGAAFDREGEVFYHADTPTHSLRRYDCDALTGSLSNCRPFHTFPFGHGRPDGGSVDLEGYYWSALFDGGRIVRIAPTGEIVAEIALPATRPTMVAFGGDDFRTAYVTTARTGLSPDELARQPLAGSLFAIPLDIGGFPEPKFGHPQSLGET